MLLLLLLLWAPLLNMRESTDVVASAVCVTSRGTMVNGTPEPSDRVDTSILYVKSKPVNDVELSRRRMQLVG